VVTWCWTSSIQGAGQVTVVVTWCWTSSQGAGQVTVVVTWWWTSSQDTEQVTVVVTWCWTSSQGAEQVTVVVLDQQSGCCVSWVLSTSKQLCSGPSPQNMSGPRRRSTWHYRSRCVYKSDAIQWLVRCKTRLCLCQSGVLSTRLNTQCNQDSPFQR